MAKRDRVFSASQTATDDQRRRTIDELTESLNKAMEAATRAGLRVSLALSSSRISDDLPDAPVVVFKSLGRPKKVLRG